MVGVGAILRIYDLGKKQLLRKCESRVKIYNRHFLKISSNWKPKVIEYMPQMPQNLSSLLVIDNMTTRLLYLLMIRSPG